MSVSDAMPGVSRLMRPNQNGDKRPAQVIHCSRCDADEPLFTGYPFPPSVLKKKFEQKGWYVDRHATRGRHLCPTCNSVMVEVAKETKMTVTPAVRTTIQGLQTAMNGAGEVRNATITDKRRINKFLMDHYDDGRGRYVDTWTDHTAAAHLHVPRKWVEDIRSEMFGPLAENTDMERVRSELGQLKAKVSGVYDEGLALSVRAESVLNEIIAMRKRLDKIAEDAGVSENFR